jgi:integrase
MGRKRSGSAYLKRGVWYVAVMLPDGARWCGRIPQPEDGLPIDEAYARRFADSLQQRAGAGKWVPPSRATKAEDPLVMEYARTWCKARTNATAVEDLYWLEMYLGPSSLARTRLRAVRPRDAIAYVGWLAARPSRFGGKLAPGSVRRVCALVGQMFRRAEIDELVLSSPWKLPPGTLPKLADKNPAARFGWRFSREEVVQIISDPRVNASRRVLYAIFFLTGCRYGEVAALRWRDYDSTLKPLGRIAVERTIDRRTRQEKPTTKTGVPREVPAHPALAAILKAWWDAGWQAHYGRAPEKNDFIVPTLKFVARARAECWNELQGDLDLLGLRRRKLHSTRHTLISMAIDDGARGDVMEWITHDASKRTIRNAYTHLSWETRCAEIAKVRIALPSDPGPKPDSATHSATRNPPIDGTPANDTGNERQPLTSRA